MSETKNEWTIAKKGEKILERMTAYSKSYASYARAMALLGNAGFLTNANMESILRPSSGPIPVLARVKVLPRRGGIAMSLENVSHIRSGTRAHVLTRRWPTLQEQMAGDPVMLVGDNDGGGRRAEYEMSMIDEKIGLYLDDVRELVELILTAIENKEDTTT